MFTSACMGGGVEYRANENVILGTRGKRDSVHCKDNSLHSLTQKANTVRPQLHGHVHDRAKQRQQQTQRPPRRFL